jgi:hypothetical protein
MFERDGALRTWAIEFTPAAGVQGAAELLADHRLEYLTYEGPVSGNRGSVSRWDCGRYDLLEDAGDCFRVRLRGLRLQQIELTFRCGPDQRWSVSFSAAGGVSGGELSSD